MDLTKIFKDVAEKIELSLRKHNFNPNYVIIFSFILYLKSFIDLVKNNTLLFVIQIILSQILVEVYHLIITNKVEDNKQEYYKISKKISYIKLMVFLCVILLKFNNHLSLPKLLIFILGFMLYIYYSPCYKDELNKDSKTNFELLSGKDKLKRIFNKRNNILNNFLFNDICSVIYLIITILILNIF